MTGSEKRKEAGWGHVTQGRMRQRNMGENQNRLMKKNKQKTRHISVRFRETRHAVKWRVGECFCPREIWGLTLVLQRGREDQKKPFRMPKDRERSPGPFLKGGVEERNEAGSKGKPVKWEQA